MRGLLTLWCFLVLANSKLRGIDEDMLCERFSGRTNCTNCVLSRSTPLAGHSQKIRCQWVAPTGHCIAAHEDAASASVAFSDWLSRSHRLAGNWKRQNFAKPACRAVIRDLAQCEENVLAELDFSCRSATQYCGGCVAQKGCSFCGELEQEGVLQGIPRIRCMRADGSSTHKYPSDDGLTTGKSHPSIASPTPCTVNCSIDSRTFEMASTNLVGAVEYPLWQRYGLFYGPGQQCKWTIPKGVRRGGGTVSGQLDVRFGKGDALHLYEASTRSSSPKVFSANSQSPIMFRNLKPPLTLEFFSDARDHSAEQPGFTFDWQLFPSPGDPQPQSSSSLAEQSSDEPDMDDAMGEGSFWIIPTVIAGGVLMLFSCICIDYMRRRRKNQQYSSEDAGVRVPPGWYQRESQAGGAYPKAAPKAQPAASKAQSGASYPKGVWSSGQGQDPKVTPKAQTIPPKAPSAVPKGKSATSATQQPPPPSGAFAKGQQPKQPKVETKAPSRQPKSKSKAPSNASKESAGPGERRGSKTSTDSAKGKPEEIDSSQYTSDPAAALAITSIHQVMVDQMDAPIGDRKQMIREWTMRWHPDKNSQESKDTSTAVFQYINGNKEWFLKDS